jgi:hypothetical protein
MDTGSILKILSRLFKNKVAYFDVIPCDHLDGIIIKQFPMLLVVNNRGSDHDGEHWVALFMESKTSPLKFFCSYGLGIESYAKNFSNFAIRLNVPVIQNKKCLQSFNSNVCGQYAIYALHRFSSGCCLMSLYCKFSRNTKSNDTKVRSFVKRMSKHSQSCKHTRSNQCCTPFQNVRDNKPLFK